MKTRICMIMSLAVLSAIACKGRGHKIYSGSAAGSNSVAEDGDNGNIGQQAEGDAKTSLTCSLAEGKAYKGFGDSDLVAGRPTEVPLQGNRYRIKPFSTLEQEFQRVVGAVPASLNANAATFSVPPARWSIEPTGNAVLLITVYRIAYEAALGYVAKDPKWATPPSEATAQSECLLFARAAWNREAAAAEISQCKQVALVDTAGEADAKTRWAYALASVLSATGFIAY